jgi:hypothetical protein
VRLSRVIRLACFTHTPVPAADAPSKDIHTFIGTFTINTPPSVSLNDVPMVQVPTVEPLSAENVLWANTVLAAGSAIGFVVYTGPETRAVMNTSHPQTKVGLLDLEISQLAKVCPCWPCPGAARADRANEDSVCCVFCAVCRAGCFERVPRILVHLRVPILDSILVDYPHQVGFWMKRIGR